MGKWWSILFGVTMTACGLLFVVAPFVGWWLPGGYSTHFWSIDRLFYVIYYVTAFFFVLTEAILCVFMYKYCGSQKSIEKPAGSPGFFAKTLAPVTRYLNDPHKVEIAWTIVPAIILLYIAFAQVSAWATAKYQSRMPQFATNAESFTPLQVDVTAFQWDWRIRYPSSERLIGWVNNKGDRDAERDFQSFARVPHKDDVLVMKDLHVWKGNPVVVQLSTRDVIHSFNLPHMRVKQDALPGKVIPTWFTPTKSNTIFDKDSGRWVDGHNPDTGKRDKAFVWDLACAELCGERHAYMVGRLYVHETQEDFLAWLKSVEKKKQPPTQAPTK